MYTVETKVWADAAIWAIPKTVEALKYENRVNPDGTISEPFIYKIYAGYNTPYDSGAVKVHEFEVVATVPAGINLMEKAVETMRREIDSIRAESYNEVTKLEKRIQDLMYITNHSE